MIHWNVGPAMKRAKLENAYQLHKASGIDYPIVRRVCSGEPVKAVRTDTLERIASALDVSDPLTLLRYAK